MDRKELLAILRQYKEANAEKYSIAALGVFGSFAKDEATAVSDVDIVLQMEVPDPYRVVHIKHDLEQRLKLPVDIVRLREKMNPFLKRRIESEAVYV